MRIDGIKITNYRSFDETGIDLNDFGNVNVFIGKNNSGKSNIIRFISQLHQFTHNKSNVPPFLHEDYFQHENQRSISFSILHKVNKTLNNLYLPYDSINSLLARQKEVFIEYAASDPERTKYEISPSNYEWFKSILPTNPSEVDRLKNEILHNNRETNSETIFKGLYDAVIKNRDLIKKEIYLINNYRKIEKNSSVKESDSEYLNTLFNGGNFVQEINKFKSPKARDRKTEKEKFLKIETFIKDILNTPEYNINIDRDESEVSLSDMPLNNLGTGIHQLLILAISVTILENCIFCIEEPEIFLHPEIQKKFINYIMQTNNQYFITTHSSSFINIEGINLYHVTNNGKKSNINRVPGIHGKNKILDDLGYKASDIFQSNYLLWVEGPTDRIYINHWIKTKAPKLVEGIHYSIMFYGGGLRAHLTVSDETVEDFINLNKINRKIGIIQDSDIKLEGAGINKSKKRIIEEFEKLGHFNWLTEGREIENYVSQNILIESCKKITKSNDVKSEITKFDSAIIFTVNGTQKELDKLSLAREAVKMPPDFTVLDLEEKINKLILEIEDANK